MLLPKITKMEKYLLNRNKHTDYTPSNNFNFAQKPIPKTKTNLYDFDVL